jgi:hypothetical protein
MDIVRAKYNTDSPNVFCCDDRVGVPFLETGDVDIKQMKNWKWEEDKILERSLIWEL